MLSYSLQFGTEGATAGHSSYEPTQIQEGTVQITLEVLIIILY